MNEISKIEVELEICPIPFLISIIHLVRSVIQI